MQFVLENVDINATSRPPVSADHAFESDPRNQPLWKSGASGGKAEEAADVMSFWSDGPGLEETMKEGARQASNGKFRQKASSLNPLLKLVEGYRANPTPKGLTAIEKEIAFMPGDKKGKYAGVLHDLRGAIDGGAQGKGQEASLLGDGGEMDGTEPDLDHELDGMAVDGPRFLADDDAKEADLARMMGQSLNVVSSAKKKLRPNDVTRKEMKRTYDLLRDVYTGQGDRNLKLKAEGGRKYDHVAEASDLGRSMPPELADREAKIQDAKLSEAQQAKAEKDLSTLLARRQALQKLKGRSKEETAELNAIGGQLDDVRNLLNPNETDDMTAYEGILGEVVKREAMKDLVRISQTGVGRDLLSELATDQSGHRVDIRAYAKKSNPDAGRAKSPAQEDFVNYTPQAFKDRDPRSVGEGPKMQDVAETNPWQINNRSDISLFHELVHTLHLQRGDLDPNSEAAGELVDKATAVHPVDAPFEGPQGPTGVRKEEYRTVGLGEFANDRMTENRYRRERRQLGETAPRRGAYVHMDEEGNRLISKDLEAS